MTSKLIPGLFFKDKHENAPDFVMCKGSIKIADLAAWLQKQEGEWVNFDLKRSRDGKPYASVDDWKPNGGSARTPAPRQSRPQPVQATEAFDDAGFDDQEIPFCTNRSIW